MSTVNVKDTKPIIADDESPKEKKIIKLTGIDKYLHGN